MRKASLGTIFLTVFLDLLLAAGASIRLRKPAPRGEPTLAREQTQGAGPV
jgi:hypothetical protein